MIVEKILLYLSAVLFTATVFGQNGFISGRVTNNQTDTMAYAKVYIDSTSYYNYANKQGNFLIKNVVPGTYEVSAYSRDRQFSAKMPNIVVKANDTTHLDIDLSFKAVQGAASVLVFTSVKKEAKLK